MQKKVMYFTSHTLSIYWLGKFRLQKSCILPTIKNEHLIIDIFYYFISFVFVFTNSTCCFGLQILTNVESLILLPPPLLCPIKYQLQELQELVLNKTRGLGGGE